MKKDLLVEKVAKSLEKKYSAVFLETEFQEQAQYEFQSLRYPAEALSKKEKKDFFTSVPRVALLKDARKRSGSKFVIEPVTMARKRSLNEILVPIFYPVRLQVSEKERYGFKHDTDTFLNELAYGIVTKAREEVLCKHGVDFSKFNGIKDKKLIAILDKYKDEIEDNVRDRVKAFNTIIVKLYDTGVGNINKKKAADPAEYSKVLYYELPVDVVGSSLLRDDMKTNRIELSVNVGNVKKGMYGLKEVTKAKKDSLTKKKETSREM